MFGPQSASMVWCDVCVRQQAQSKKEPCYYCEHEKLIACSRCGYFSCLNKNKCDGKTPDIPKLKAWTAKPVFDKVISQ